jgi:hypothetical protein
LSSFNLFIYFCRPAQADVEILWSLGSTWRRSLR